MAGTKRILPMIFDVSQKEQIYADYHEKVLGYVRGKVANSTEAEDIASDVFVKVYSKLDAFDATKASLSTWIYHITQNTVIDYYRKRHVFSEIPETVAGDENLEAHAINEEMLESLADALERLDERSRNLIVLHYYSGMKLKDIADKMEISYVYTKVLHKKSLVTLRNCLCL